MTHELFGIGMTPRASLATLGTGVQKIVEDEEDVKNHREQRKKDIAPWWEPRGNVQVAGRAHTRGTALSPFRGAAVHIPCCGGHGRTLTVCLATSPLKLAVRVTVSACTNSQKKTPLPFCIGTGFGFATTPGALLWIAASPFALATLP